MRYEICETSLDASGRHLWVWDEATGEQEMLEPPQAALFLRRLTAIALGDYDGPAAIAAGRLYGSREAREMLPACRSWSSRFSSTRR